MLDVIRDTGCNLPEYDLLRRTATGQRGNFVFQFFLGHQNLIVLLDLHGVAQCAGGSGDDRDLLHRCGSRLQSSDQRMANLMVGDDLLFIIGHDGVFLLIAGDDDLNAFLQVCLLYDCAPTAHRTEGSFVDDVRKLCAGGSGGHTGDGMEVHIVRRFDLLRMDLEDGFTTCEVRQLHGNTAVKAAGAGQRRVKGLRAVGRRQNDDAVVAFKAVHLGQKLVKRLFTLIVAAYLTIALFTDGIDLIDKDDTGRFFLGLLEQVTHF